LDQFVVGVLAARDGESPQLGYVTVFGRPLDEFADGIGVSTRGTLAEVAQFGIGHGETILRPE
jgi:hypothetical protein